MMIDMKIKMCLLMIGLITFGFSLQGKEKSQFIRNLESGKKQTLVTYGTSLTSHGAWVKQLQSELKKKFSGKARLINSGKSGMWSKWGVDNLDTRVIAKQPDTVLIEFSMNDAHTKYSMTVAKARNNLENMIERILKHNHKCEIILMVMNPAVGKFSKVRPDLLAHYQMYRDVAKERNLLLIDHYQNWKKLLDKSPDQFKKLVPDGVHPTSKGCIDIITPEMIKSLGM